MSAPARVGVAVLGATGLVGARLVRGLQHHPWMRLDEVVASPESAGRRLGDRLDTDLDPGTAALELLAPGAPLRSPVVLSALPGAAARALEIDCAKRGHLVSTNSSAFRLDERVPLVIPEVNPAAIDCVARQPWSGALVANPNCMVAGLALALAPLAGEYGLRSATVVTLQALSGAGRRGLAAWEHAGNVVPHIAGEAGKLQPELNKLLGAEFPVSVKVNRVPVLDGHLAAVFVRLGRRVSSSEVRATLARPHRGGAHGLPSAPATPLRLLEAPDRPQPRRDAGAGGGMTVSVGGIEADPAYDVRFTVLVHNLARGAAGACLLNAELALRRGYPRRYRTFPDGDTFMQA